MPLRNAPAHAKRRRCDTRTATPTYHTASAHIFTTLMRSRHHPQQYPVAKSGQTKCPGRRIASAGVPKPRFSTGFFGYSNTFWNMPSSQIMTPLFTCGFKNHKVPYIRGYQKNIRISVKTDCERPKTRLGALKTAHRGCRAVCAKRATPPIAKPSREMPAVSGDDRPTSGRGSRSACPGRRARSRRATLQTT